MTERETAVDFGIARTTIGTNLLVMTTEEGGVPATAAEMAESYGVTLVKDGLIDLGTLTDAQVMKIARVLAGDPNREVTREEILKLLESQ